MVTETGGPIYTLDQMGDMTVETVKALVHLPAKVWGVGRAIVGLEERDPESPVSIVGGGRFAGETVSHETFPVQEKTVFLLSLIAGFNFFIGVFNFVPLLPLDGGHIASALWEALRRGVARLRRRPDPGYVDAARLLPVAYVVASALLVMGMVLIVGDLVVPAAHRRQPSPRLGASARCRCSCGCADSAAAEAARNLETMTAISLGMPEAPPPVLSPRRPTRQIKVGKVRRRQRVADLGPVDDHDADLRRQRDPPADRRADRHRLRHRAGGLPEPGRRRRAAGDRAALADPGHRRHPLPAEVRLRRDRRRLRGGPGQPRQHPQVRRPGQGDRGRRQGPRHQHPDRRQRRVARQAA